MKPQQQHINIYIYSTYHITKLQHQLALDGFIIHSVCHLI